MQQRQKNLPSAAERDAEDVNVEAACPIQETQELVPAADCDDDGDDFGLKDCIKMMLAVGVKVFIMRFMDRIGESGHMVTFYALIADGCAICICLAFFFLGLLLPNCMPRYARNEQKIALVKVTGICLANIIALAAISYLQSLSPTAAHGEVGWSHVVFRANTALTYELLFEFMPGVMGKLEDDPTVWCLGVIYRVAVQLTVFSVTHALMDAHVLLSGILVIQAFLHCVFWIFAWICAKKFASSTATAKYSSARMRLNNPQRCRASSMLVSTKNNISDFASASLLFRQRTQTS